ncbi:hypothetical protein [Nocardiopsis potens]|nr:hypothetical protein [Nocardiopsis potens]
MFQQYSSRMLDGYRKVSLFIGWLPPSIAGYRSSRVPWIFAT